MQWIKRNISRLYCCDNWTRCDLSQTQLQSYVSVLFNFIRGLISIQIKLPLSPFHVIGLSLAATWSMWEPSVIRLTTLTSIFFHRSLTSRKPTVDSRPKDKYTDCICTITMTVPPVAVTLMWLGILQFLKEFWILSPIHVYWLAHCSMLRPHIA